MPILLALAAIVGIVALTAHAKAKSHGATMWLPELSLTAQPGGHYRASWDNAAAVIETVAVLNKNPDFANFMIFTDPPQGWPSEDQTPGRVRIEFTYNGNNPYVFTPVYAARLWSLRSVG